MGTRNETQDSRSSLLPPAAALGLPKRRWWRDLVVLLEALEFAFEFLHDLRVGGILVDTRHLARILLEIVEFPLVDVVEVQ